MGPDYYLDPPHLAVYERLPDTGQDAAQLVVLVHGTMDRATSFAKVTRRLAEFHTLRYDRRGYGDSAINVDGMPVLPATDLQSAANDLLAVVDGRRSVLVGHSMGGTIALAAAMTQPEMVEAVIAYESPLPFATTADQRPSNPESDPAEAAEKFMRQMIGDAQWERLPASSRKKRRAEGPALIADRELWNGESNYQPSRLVVPVVAAYGGNSSEHHRQSAFRLAELVPQATLAEIEGASHGAHLTHPDAFAELIRATAAQFR